MEAKYKFGHRPGRRRRTRISIVVFVTTIIVGAVLGLIWLDLKSTNDSKEVEGSASEVGQLLDDTTDVVWVDEPTFTMELPSDWKEVARENSVNERSITWQSTKPREDNRTLQVFVDLIPEKMAVTRLLPLTVRGEGFTVGEASSSCSTFTKLGDGTGRQDLDAPAKYQNVSFICALGRSIDNVTGTGSSEGINTISVKGPSAGKHRYFFVYADRNIQPNIAIFYDALKSFRAK